MASNEDQRKNSDKSGILSDGSSLNSFDPTTSEPPSINKPTENCFPDITDDPICVPSNTPNPSHREQPNQPISAYDQVTKSDDSRMNQPPIAYSPPSLDYRNYDRIPHAHIDLPSAPPTSSHYGGPADQRQYGNTYPNPQPYYLPQQSQAILPQQQQQPQVIYVVAQPPMAHDNVDNSDLECSIIGAIVLSILLLLFCWCSEFFAVRLAARAYEAAKNGDRAGAIKWRNTSYGLSIAAIIIAGVAAGICIGVLS